MNHIHDITGQRFGRLTVIKYVGIGKHGYATWLCKCDCGNTKIVSGHCLRRGNTHSCGCLAKESRYVHGMKGTRLYNIWQNMKCRCYNKNHPAYPNYGGRGITICDEWRHDFSAFHDCAMSHGYADGLTIERIDNDGNYTPDNCRWATRFEQSQNTRRNRIIEMDGERKTLAEWARQYNLNYCTVISRINKHGWTPEKALKTPPLKKAWNRK